MRLLTILVLSAMLVSAARASSDEWVYWAEGNHINRARPDGTSEATVVQRQNMLCHTMAFDPIGEKFYWSDVVMRNISSANLDGSGLVDLPSGPGSFVAPRGITVDAGRRQLYWTDYISIRRAGLDGSNPTTLITQGPGTDIAIANTVCLDSQADKIYWTDLSANWIQRSNLDGSQVEPLLTGLNGPNGMVLDLPHGKMYWNEYYAGKIMRSNLDGSGMETLLTGIDSVGLAIDPIGNKLYWTAYDGSLGIVQRSNLDGTDVEDYARINDIPGAIMFVPEPVTLSLLTLGGLLIARRRV